MADGHVLYAGAVNGVRQHRRAEVFVCFCYCCFLVKVPSVGMCKIILIYIPNGLGCLLRGQESSY